ncbi:testis-expressed protein 36 [Myripristis murdjan]|uniref:testis-expressed protein 36 n=1 Tax=Myripristis murdjan TaxID=586833 RepID=UPI001175EBF6|nr:testis-expressed protein 36 [Myripristis murdjan]
MVKGGKQYSSVSNDGKWVRKFQFAHTGSPEDNAGNRETSTSTGTMLTQIESSLPQALNFKRYPKWKSQQKSREYPLSAHDNRRALQDSIAIFTHGVGRRKCLDDRRQHNSHFCLCHDEAGSGTGEAGGNVTAYQTDYVAKQGVDVATGNKRFPHNHQQRSAAAARARE